MYAGAGVGHRRCSAAITARRKSSSHCHVNIIIIIIIITNTCGGVICVVGIIMSVTIAPVTERHSSSHHCHVIRHSLAVPPGLGHAMPRSVMKCLQGRVRRLGRLMAPAHAVWPSQWPARPPRRVTIYNQHRSGWCSMLVMFNLGRTNNETPSPSLFFNNTVIVTGAVG